jgi:hypothetical protein
VRLVSCLHNEREAHMLGGGDEEDAEESESDSEGELLLCCGRFLGLLFPRQSM